MRKDSWLEIEKLWAEFNELGINKAVDYDKYYLYSLITHSTAIEGSTLTEVETQLLFDEGITANGKPLVYHLMNEDLKQAYEYVIEEAKQHKPVTPLFLQRLSGIIGRSYMNYQKVPVKVDELCVFLQEKQKQAFTLQEQYELSFNAHLNLATIHPWVDGNGRMARLLMNYIQFVYQIFPTKLFKEDRGDYILALRKSQDEETNLPFLDFMTDQLRKSISLEIDKYKASKRKGFSFMF